MKKTSPGADSFKKKGKLSNPRGHSGRVHGSFKKHVRNKNVVSEKSEKKS